MLFTAVDLGTQTFRVGIGELNGNHVLPVCSRLFNVRLGDALPKGRLTPRVLNGIDGIKATLSEYPAGHTRVCGTEAVRRLKERFPGQFSRLEALLGYPIHILPPDEEGRLTALGAVTALDLQEGDPPVLILDVGGGSTEAIFYTPGSITVKSMPIGAVTFQERSRGQLASLANPPFVGARTVVATGGTATTLGAMVLGLTTYAPLKIRGLCVKVETILDWIDRLASLSLDERGDIRGLDPQRADIIIPGLRILGTCLGHLGVREIIISDGGLLMGILIDLVKKEFKDHAQLDWRRLHV